MPSTKATASRGRFQRVESATETDDNLDEQPKRRNLFDFSDGKFPFTLTIFQIISLCTFIAGIVWFLAAEWRFEMKAVNLKGEIDQKFNQFINDQEAKTQSKFNILEKELRSTEDSLNNLKIRNSYLK